MTVASQTARLTVTIPTPPSITRQPQDLTVDVGGSASLSVEAVGSAPLSYQWFSGNVSLPGEISATLTLHNISSAQDRTYRVIVSNSAGSVSSASARLTVQDALADQQVLIAETLNERTSSSVNPAAIKFIPPAAAGRPDRSGIMIISTSSFDEIGSQWEFEWERNDNGVEVIHPFKDGQCILKIRRDSITLDTPKRWLDKGYNFGTPLTHTAGYDRFFPLRDGSRYRVKTFVSPAGEISLFMNDTLVARGSLSVVYPIDFTIGPGESFFDQAVWPETRLFSGKGFPLKWQKGYTGIIVEPVEVGGVPSAYNRLFRVTYSPGPPPPASITQQPIDVKVDPGQTATFSVATTGTPPLRYQWLFGNTVLPRATNATLILREVTIGQAGDYSVRISDASQIPVTSRPARLTVVVPPPPAITRQPSDVTAIPGDAVTFSVGVSGTPPFQFQWFRSLKSLAGETNATLTLGNVTDAAAGDYFVSVSNASTEIIISRSARLSVVAPAPASITEPPQDLRAIVGTTATFTALAGGTPPLQYQWSFNGAKLSDETNSTLTLRRVTVNQSGDYTVTINNRIGTPATSPAARLTVALPPPPPTPANLIAFWDFNDASDSQRTVDSVSGHVANFVNGVINTADRGGWSGEVGDRAVDFGTDSANRSVRNQTMTTAFNQAAAGDRITISFWQRRSGPITNGSTFWFVSPSSEEGRGLQAHVPWNDNEIYFDSAGCCNPATQRIHASISTFTTMHPDAFFASWHHFAFLKSNAVKQIWIDGSLFLQGTNKSALPTNFTEMILGFQPGGPVNNLHGLLDDFAVFGSALSADRVSLLAQGVSPLNMGPGTAQAPTIIQPPQGQPVAAGSSVTLNVTALGTPPLQYEWFFGNKSLPSENGSTITLTSFTASQAGAYQVFVSNAYGSVASASASLTIHDPLAPPTNDLFANRTVLFGLATNATNNNANATKETDEPSHAGKAGGRSIWWTWTAPLDGNVTITTAGSTVDTALAVYVGKSVGSLSEIASNDADPRGGTSSSVTFRARAGDDYQIAVDTFGAQTGVIKLNLTAQVERPALHLGISGQNLVLSWPLNTVGFSLESAETLGSTWNRVVLEPVVDGTSFSLKLPLNGESRFYRLIRHDP